ncbi:ankyrin repeat-containing protein [Fusarium mundagurra]|uniref:Ankyrin repeat-containing protein n=1 Tax=Fusarium mundagurra TaxID=1567541 RepID=A0A8H6CZF6_9HYPO|nr:ankyrin repeat-containing protein [Fusarium mundagurra]
MQDERNVHITTTRDRSSLVVEPERYDDVDQQSRVAHCGYRLPGDRTYRFNFPSDGFEIDKDNLCFVSDGVSLPEQPPRDQLKSLKTKFREAVDGKPLWGDVGRAQAERIDRTVSNMYRGVLEPLREFLDDTRGSQIHNVFLNGVESWEHDEWEDEEAQSRPTSGKTVLQLAACESHPEVVRLLLEEGAGPNSADLDGRTPLMEAALWGRLENVELLLEHGANPDLRCIHNETLRRAVDFAKPTRENYETRSSNRLYRENVHQMDIHRREIVRILEGQAARPAQPAMQLDGFSFSRRSNDPRSLSLTTHYSLPTEWKTVARLIRGGSFPEISAMSGWGHDEDESTHVAGCEWTTWVLGLCEIIDFTPERHDYDNGTPGRYYACHAEKQLITYFVHKHCFLDLELAIPPEPEQRTNLLYSST